jgi:hypothetical protein
MPSGTSGSEYIHGFIILDPNLIPVQGAEYIYTYIDTSAPHPTILGNKPGKVRTADTITVMATGVGSTQGTYTGRIQGQDSTGSWLDLTPSRWQSVAADPDAETINRIITDDMETVDVEHVEIDVVVPNWATPPQLPIRVITDTP